MVIIERTKWGLHDKLVLFPREDELLELLESVNELDLLRIRQSYSKLNEHPKMVQHYLSRTVCIDLTKSLEDIYNEMDPKSCRYEIRKAKKVEDLLEIKMNENESDNDFRRIENDFVKVKRYRRPFSEKRLNEFMKVSDRWVIYHSGRPVCGHMLIRDDISKKVRLWISASNRLQSDEMAKLCSTLNRYLHWQEIQYYKDQGILIYDFGGIGGDIASPIASFKSSFGGFQIDEYSYVFSGIIGRIGIGVYKKIKGIIKL